MEIFISLDTCERNKAFLREEALQSVYVYAVSKICINLKTHTGLTQHFVFLEEDEFRKFILGIILEQIDSLFIFRLEK